MKDELPSTADLSPKDRELQHQFRKLHWEISTLKKKAGIAHDQRIVAIADAAELRRRCKIAVNSLRALEPDAHRYRWLKKLGCDDAFTALRRWETDAWDYEIDKALNKRPKR